MLGGVAINQFDPLTRILGADASALNALDAVREANRMVSES